LPFHAACRLEAPGLWSLGEAAGFLGGGKTIAADGRLPLSTHGGQFPAGRTHRFGFSQEAAEQLRGKAGRVAVAATGGGTRGGAMTRRRAG
jgi:hypothetical protein